VLKWRLRSAALQQQQAQAVDVIAHVMVQACAHLGRPVGRCAHGRELHAIQVAPQLVHAAEACQQIPAAAAAIHHKQQQQGKLTEFEGKALQPRQYTPV
jgi:hypothetical protein